MAAVTLPSRRYAVKTRSPIPSKTTTSAYTRVLPPITTMRRWPSNRYPESAQSRSGITFPRTRAATAALANAEYSIAYCATNSLNSRNRNMKAAKKNAIFGAMSRHSAIATRPVVAGMLRRRFASVGFPAGSTPPAGARSARLRTLRRPVRTPGPSRQLFEENRHAQIARLNALADAELQDLHDLLSRGSGPQRGLDVAAYAWRIHVREGRIAGYAEELELLGRQYAALVDRDDSREELVSPRRVEGEEGVPGCIPSQGPVAVGRSVAAISALTGCWSGSSVLVLPPWESARRCHR